MISRAFAVFSPLLIALMLIAFILYGCAVNPATKQIQFMTVSEEREFQIGRSVDKKVRQTMGVYLELPQLRAYVKKMAESIGRQSDRPNLIYRLEIVDTPDFNAFAVPGGFVYVHRGLLERMNSADELASVLGHEIAHVAARHSAEQISRSQLLNFGLLALSVATHGSVQDYGQIINLGSALAFNKFSRDDERQADYLGTKYMVKAGYNPLAALDLMHQLRKLQHTEPSALQVWFMTHPPTSERIANLTREIAEIRQTQAEVLKRPVKRNELIALLDGLAVGEWNGKEFINGDRYYNKEYLLSMAIPPGWIPHINSQQFTAVFDEPKKGFVAYFNIKPLRTRRGTAEYFRDFQTSMEKAGLQKAGEIRPTPGLPHNARAGLFTGYSRQAGPVTAEGIAFVRWSNAFSLLAISKQADFNVLRPLVESMAGSIRFLSPKEAATLKPARLRIHKVRKGETWAGITKKYFHSSEKMLKLAEYNGFEISDRLTAGTLLKIPPSLHFR